MSPSLLIIECAVRPDTAVSSTLCAPGVGTELAVGAKNGLRRLKAQCFDLVFIADDLPEMNELLFLQQVLQGENSPGIVVFSPAPSVQRAVEVMRAGALDFVSLPLDPLTVARAYRRARKSSSHLRSEENKDGIKVEALPFATWRTQFAAAMVGEHPALKESLQSIRRISETSCDVLLTGASGTGKELAARAIHAASARRNRPFVALNCAAIPKDLMEAEIFGHARGAFTGATERRAGKFEAAHTGTLFLDEVGEMDLTLQSKLLRVLQERELTPIGECRAVKLDFRVIAATNQDLTQLCRDRMFREDLYYRLHVVPVHLPTLAERKEDIPLLTHSFIQRANRRHGRKIKGISDAALAYLCRHTWPGNIRELHNVIERMAVLKRCDEAICPEDLPPALRNSVASLRLAAPLAYLVEKQGSLALPDQGLDINETLANMEMTLTLNALRRSGGNKARAAELLGLKRTTLVERLKKLNLPASA